MRVDYYLSQSTGLEVVERDTGLTLVFNKTQRGVYWSRYARDRSCYEDSGTLDLQGAREDFFRLYGLVRELGEKSSDSCFEITADAEDMRSEAVVLERRVLSMMCDCLRIRLRRTYDHELPVGDGVQESV